MPEEKKEWNIPRGAAATKAKNKYRDTKYDSFYCWKAKAENLEKIKNRSPEMESSLSDFSNLGSQ